jgi:hypothetical protein
VPASHFFAFDPSSTAASSLNAVAEIPAKLNGLEHHFVAGPKNCDLRQFSEPDTASE